MKPSVTVILSIAALLSACNNAADSNTSISGKWKYEKMETQAEGPGPGGLTVVFTNEGAYYSIEEKASLTDTVETGRYEIINNGKQLVTMGTATIDGDTVNIIELSANTLKIETPAKTVMVLKKVQ